MKALVMRAINTRKSSTNGGCMGADRQTHPPTPLCPGECVTRPRKTPRAYLHPGITSLSSALFDAFGIFFGPEKSPFNLWGVSGVGLGPVVGFGGRLIGVRNGGFCDV